MLKNTNDKWLDLNKLFFQILNAQLPNSELLVLKFFTADIRASIATHAQEAQHSQQDYQRALKIIHKDKIQIIKGYYALDKARLLAYQKPPDKSARLDVWKLEEKQTDVNMALEAYRDAVKNNAEQLVFVSNDTDLAPALAAIKEDLGDTIKLGVIIPTRKNANGRPGNQQLSKYADWTRKYITNEELAESQLPQKIPTKKKPILKPKYW